jgi:hypothetical protein
LIELGLEPLFEENKILRQRHTVCLDLVELLANEKIQLVPIVRLVLHACHEEPEFASQIFERHALLLGADEDLLQVNAQDSRSVASAHLS